MTAVKLLSRIWLPLVILLVLGLGGYAVVRLHGVFGSEKYPTYASGPQTDTKPVNQKQLVYEVFGPEGTVADISYFDAQAQPQQITGAALPWTVTVTSDSPAVVGSVVAQGDSYSIGCRISVNGEIKDEKVSNEAHAFTSCLVKGA